MRACLAALLLVLGAPSIAATKHHYETRALHDPDGIGKFYFGREIAQVMGPGGVPWLERAGREAEERPQLLIDALEIKRGQTIADLGAGSGYYTFRIAPVVGEQGKVLAIDVEPRMLRVIRNAPNVNAWRTCSPCSALRAIPTCPRTASTCCSWSMCITSWNSRWR